MPHANALKSIGFMDTVLFQTIGNFDINQHKSSGKLATEYYPSIGKPVRVTTKY